MVTGDGKTYLFPGDEANATALATYTIGREALDHPLTRVEHGYTFDSKWYCQSVLKECSSHEPDRHGQR